MKITKLISLVIVFLFAIKSQSQEIYTKKKVGIKQINTYLIPTGETLKDETESKKIEFYDAQGHIIKTENEWSYTVYEYNNLGEVSINKKRKENDELFFLKNMLFSKQTV